MLHVVDASSPDAEDQIGAVNAVLDELGLKEHPTILVLNKADRVPDRSYLDVLKAHHDESIAVSAVTGDGLDRLEQAVREALNEHAVDAEVDAEAGDGRVLAYLARHALIRDRQYRDGRVTVDCRLPRRCLGYLAEHGIAVRTDGDRLPA